MQDDISQLLILNKKANVEQQIFASELEKFRPHQQRIMATIQHQQQAIQNLTAAFKDLMEGDEAQNLQSQHDKADRLVRGLSSDFGEAKSIYFEIKEGFNRGIQFYSGVQDTVDNLNRNIQRFIAERGNERSRMMDDIESNKSTREQEMLRETLNKYASAPPPPPTQTLSSSSISHLTNQTRQMSMGDTPSTPSYNPGFTPAPPPKPQAFQPATAPQSPYGIYGASNASTPTGGAPPFQQQPSYGSQRASPYGGSAPPPIPPQPSPYAHHQPQYGSPVYNAQPTYQQPQYGHAPQQPYQAPPQQQHQAPYQAPPQGHYGQAPPQPYHNPSMGGMMPPQGYQPQYQQQPPPQQWQQQQAPPQQQWQQQQQPYAPRPPPGGGSLLD